MNPFAKKYGFSDFENLQLINGFEKNGLERIVELIISHSDCVRKRILEHFANHIKANGGLYKVKPDTKVSDFDDIYKKDINSTTLEYAVELDEFFAKYRVYVDKCDAKNLKEAEKIKNEVEVKVVKKDTKKEQTRNANKALSDKKAEKAAYEKQCIAAAIIKAAQEQKKKAKKAKK
jgi:hypothetical protein